MAGGRESSLDADSILVVAAPSLGSILHHQGGAGWSWGRCASQYHVPVIKFSIFFSIIEIKSELRKKEALARRKMTVKNGDLHQITI